METKKVEAIKRMKALDLYKPYIKAFEKENKILLLEDELQKAKAALEDQTKRLKEIAKLAKIKE